MTGIAQRGNGILIVIHDGHNDTLHVGTAQLSWRMG